MTPTRTVFFFGAALAGGALCFLLGTTFAPRSETPVSGPRAPAGDSGQLDAVERRLDLVLERLDSLEARTGRPTFSAASGVATANREAGPTTPEALPAAARPVPLADLILEADSRLHESRDLAGAILRYRTALERRLDAEQRVDFLRKIGLAYGRLDKRDESLRHLRQAVDEAPSSSVAVVGALYDLIVALDDTSDRELLDLAQRYVESDGTNAEGLEEVHLLTAQAARRQGLPGRERPALRHLVDHAPGLALWAKQRLAQLGE